MNKKTTPPKFQFQWTQSRHSVAQTALQRKSAVIYLLDSE